jgi:hypothetical protein
VLDNGSRYAYGKDENESRTSGAVFEDVVGMPVDGDGFVGR